MEDLGLLTWKTFQVSMFGHCHLSMGENKDCQILSYYQHHENTTLSFQGCFFLWNLIRPDQSLLHTYVYVLYMNIMYIIYILWIWNKLCIYMYHINILCSNSLTSIQATMFHPIGPNFLRSCTTAWKKQKPKSNVLKVSLVLRFNGWCKHTETHWNTWDKGHKEVLKRLNVVQMMFSLGN